MISPVQANLALRFQGRRSTLQPTANPDPVLLGRYQAVANMPATVTYYDAQGLELGKLAPIPALVKLLRDQSLGNGPDGVPVTTLDMAPLKGTDPLCRYFESG